MKKRIPIAVAAVAFSMVVASAIPGPYVAAVTVNPGGMPVENGLVRRACADCHSNETKWPWYSRVAPISWMVRKDVSDGRRMLNFSLWADYGAEGQRQLGALAKDQVREGTMPPSRYLMLHPEARLSAAEKADLLGELDVLAAGK